MADISKIQLDNQVYNIKDEVARAALDASKLDIDDNFTVTCTKTVDTNFPLIYYITRISPNPQKIDHVPLKGHFAGDSLATAETTSEALIDMAKQTNAVFISNASALPKPNVYWIRDGIALNTTYTASGAQLAITKYGDLMFFDNTFTLEELLSTYHVENTWTCHGKIVVNGVMDASNWADQAATSPSTVNDRHPRTAIFQLQDDKDIYFIHIEGRKPESAGVTFLEMGSLIKSLYPTVRICSNLGGGGDSQLILKGEVVNDCTDPQIRQLHDSIYLDANIHADDYTVAEKEIADGRNVTYTLHDLMTTFLPYNKNYLTARAILQAEHVSGNQFICNLDYNTNLKVGDSVLIQFDDLDYDDIVPSNNITINIHSSSGTGGGQTNVRFETSHFNAYPNQVKNRLVVATWDGERYNIQDNHIFANGVAADTSVNSITDGGLYYSGSFTNTPSNSGGWLAVLPHLSNASYYYQIYLSRPTNKIYFRAIENGTAGDWKQISTADEIVPNMVDDLTNLDANNITGKIRIGYGNSISNRPASAANGWLINIPYLSGNNVAKYGQQIYMERYTASDKGRIYVRTLENNTWSAWKQLQFVS